MAKKEKLFQKFQGGTEHRDPAGAAALQTDSRFLKTITLLVCMLFISVANAQVLNPVCESGGCGYKDEKGKMVIPLQYEAAEPFSEDLASVKVKGKWGYVNKKGRQVTTPDYDSADFFSEGLAAVKKNGKWGFINKKGKEIIPFRYFAASAFYKGLAAVSLNDSVPEVWGHDAALRNQKRKYDPASSVAKMAREFRAARMGYVDKAAKERIYDRIVVRDSLWLMKKKFRHRATAPGLISVSLGGKWGLLNPDGTQKTALDYERLESFSSGFAAVMRNGKWSFINKEGRDFACTFDSVIEFERPDVFDLPVFIGLGGGIGTTMWTPLPGPDVDVLKPYARVKRNGKWGAIDTACREIIPTKYDHLRRVTFPGLMQVNLGGVIDNGYIIGGKWGFVDLKGREVVPLDYDELYHFGIGLSNDAYSSGFSWYFAQASINGRTVYLTASGQLYNGVENLYYLDYTAVKTGTGSVYKNGRTYAGDKWGLNYQGKTLTPVQYDEIGSAFRDPGLINVKRGDKWGFVDTLGKEKVPLIFDNIIFNERESGFFHSGLALVMLNEKFGFVNKAGVVLSPQQSDPLVLKYQKAEAFHEGRAWVALKDKYALIDSSGKELTAYKYSTALNFERGFAIVAIADKVGLVDRNGRELLPLKYEDIRLLEGELTIKVKTAGKWGLLDTLGRELLPAKYDEIVAYQDGFSTVINNGKWGITNRAGKEIVPLRYDEALKFDQKNLLRVKYKNRFGLCDTAGRFLAPIKYTTLDYFQKDLSSASTGGSYHPSVYRVVGAKWGFLDTTGREIIPVTYDTIMYFYAGYAASYKGKQWGILDSTGKEVVPNNFEAVAPLAQAPYFFTKGYAQAKLNGKWALIDRSGTVLTPFVYSSIEELNEGLFMVNVDGSRNQYGTLSGGKWGCIDTSGKMVIAPQYDYSFLFRDGSASVSLNGKSFEIDKTGKKIE